MTPERRRELDAFTRKLTEEERKALKGKQLTDEEFKQGYHYCVEWDYMFIGPEDQEFECCLCFAKVDIKSKRIDKNEL